MKKLLLASLVGTLLVGCGKSDSDSVDTNLKPTPVSPSTLENDEIHNLEISSNANKLTKVEDGVQPDTVVGAKIKDDCSRYWFVQLPDGSTCGLKDKLK